jgi:hypothetical protein
MKWFGQPGGAAYEQDSPHVDTPVGQACAWCGEAIEADDCGVTIPHFDGQQVGEQPWHYECNLRVVIGGLNHQMGLCTCCGGNLEPDPPHLSRHEAAILAAAFHHRRAARRFKRAFLLDNKAG